MEARPPESESDRLLSTLHDAMRQIECLYAQICADCGLDPNDQDTDHAADPNFDARYYPRRDELFEQAATAAQNLIAVIEAGGSLPTAWTQRRA